VFTPGDLQGWTSFCFVSRIAGYVIRMSGDVGGALSDGRPYPDKPYPSTLQNVLGKAVSNLSVSGHWLRSLCGLLLIPIVPLPGQMSWMPASLRTRG